MSNDKKTIPDGRIVSIAEFQMSILSKFSQMGLFTREEAIEAMAVNCGVASATSGFDFDELVALMRGANSETIRHATQTPGVFHREGYVVNADGKIDLDPTPRGQS